MNPLVKILNPLVEMQNPLVEILNLLLEILNRLVETPMNPLVRIRNLEVLNHCQESEILFDSFTWTTILTRSISSWSCYEGQHRFVFWSLQMFRPTALYVIAVHYITVISRHESNVTVLCLTAFIYAQRHVINICFFLKCSCMMTALKNCVVVYRTILTISLCCSF